MLNKLIRPIIVPLLLITISISLEYKSNSQELKEKKKTEIPVFDVHIAASINHGLRAGARYYLSKNYSAELSYGFDLDILGGSEGGQIIELGINVYPLKEHSLLISVIGLYNTREDYDSYYIISPCFGFLTPRDKGFQFLARAGLSIIRTTYKGSNNTKLKPNIEIGIGVSF